MADPEKPHPLEERTGGVRTPTIRKLARDGKTWTPTEQRTRDKLLKQFCKAGRKGVEVASGNSEDFKDGWDMVFGTPEQKRAAKERRRMRQAGIGRATIDDLERAPVDGDGYLLLEDANEAFRKRVPKP